MSMTEQTVPNTSVADGPSNVFGKSGKETTEDFINQFTKRINSLIKWHNPTHSATVLSGSIFSILIVSCFSSWLFYYALKTLVYVTSTSFVSIVGTMLVQGMLGREAMNPLRYYLANPFTVSPTLTQSYACLVTLLINKLISSLTSLILVSRPLKTFQFLSIIWLIYRIAYYIPLSAFLITAIIGIFTVPITLERNKEQVRKYESMIKATADTNLKILRTYIEKVYQSIQSMISSKTAPISPPPTNEKPVNVDAAIKKEE